MMIFVYICLFHAIIYRGRACASWSQVVTGLQHQKILGASLFVAPNHNLAPSSFLFFYYFNPV
jgi:hypothetical protein